MNMNKDLIGIVRVALAPLDEHVPERRDGRVDVAGRPFVLVSAGTGLPRDVDRILPQLSPEAIAVASRFTSKARARLNAAGANWADQTAARIRARDGALAVLVDGGEPAPQPEAATGFSPAALRVGERLLIARAVEPVAAIAAAAQVSQGRVAQVLRWFDEQGFTAKHGDRGPTARRTLDTAALLDAWAAEIRDEWRPIVLANMAARDPRSELENLTRGLGTADLHYRLTGWVGLDRAAPFLTQTPAIHIYLDATAFAAIPAELGHLGLVPVEEAGVVTFWQAPEVTFTAADGDHHVVHPARLIADLRRLGGRGMDAAEHVRGELFDVA